MNGERWSQQQALPRQRAMAQYASSRRAAQSQSRADLACAISLLFACVVRQRKAMDKPLQETWLEEQRRTKRRACQKQNVKMRHNWQILLRWHSGVRIHFRPSLVPRPLFYVVSGFPRIVFVLLFLQFKSPYLKNGK